MKSRLKIKVLKAGGVYDPRGKEFNSFGARKSIQSIRRFTNETNHRYRKYIQRAKSKGVSPFPANCREFSEQICNYKED